MGIRLYYAPINNMGDDLNRLIFENIFKQKIEKARIDNFQIMGIGSCLANCFYCQNDKNDSIKVIAKKFSSFLHGTAHVWGTGFIEEYPFQDMRLIRNNIQFDIVRGELTRHGVSKVLGHDIDVPLADGGLLAPMLVQDKKIIKSEKIGIVPHYREKNDPRVSRLMEYIGEKALLIDVQDDSINVLKQIASCEYVISSSLHGLIVEDAFGIPNTRIKITDNLLGTGFKFDDYYSAFEMKKPAVIISDDNYDLKRLFSQAQIDFLQVKRKQKQLIDSMNNILKTI